MSAVEVLGMAEAAEVIGVSKSNFTTHRQKFNGEGQCPAPTAQLASGPVWVGKDVAALRRWAKEWARTRTARNPRRSPEEIAKEKAAADKKAKTPAPAKKAEATKPAAKTPTDKPAAKPAAAAKKAPAAPKPAPAKKAAPAKATAPAKKTGFLGKKG